MAEVRSENWVQSPLADLPLLAGIGTDRVEERCGIGRGCSLVRVAAGLGREIWAASVLPRQANKPSITFVNPIPATHCKSDKASLH